MKRTLPGTNQYVTRYAVAKTDKAIARRRRNRTRWTNQSGNKNMMTWLTIYGIIVSSIFFTKLGFEQLHKQAHAQTIISPIATGKTVVKSEKKVIFTPTPTATEDPDSCESRIKEQKNIKSYIYSIFGNEADNAYAISLAESGVGCGGSVIYKTKALHHSQWEHSVGIFQINLMSAAAKVHYDRVPGDTLEQKEKWLDDPKNNTLFAYWIYSTSGWNPWSTFTNGAYLAFE
jgi:hypothetical protein